jgi:hypothetical protein
MYQLRELPTNIVTSQQMRHERPATLHPLWAEPL